jgi:hypothetical protein
MSGRLCRMPLPHEGLVPRLVASQAPQACSKVDGLPIALARLCQREQQPPRLPSVSCSPAPSCADRLIGWSCKLVLEIFSSATNVMRKVPYRPKCQRLMHLSDVGYLQRPCRSAMAQSLSTSCEAFRTGACRRALPHPSVAYGRLRSCRSLYLTLYWRTT